MIAICEQRLVQLQNSFAVAFGSQADETDQRFIHAQVEQRVVEFAICLQWPVGSAQFLNLFGCSWLRTFRRLNCQIGEALFAIEFKFDVFVVSRVVSCFKLQWRELIPGPAGGADSTIF